NADSIEIRRYRLEIRDIDIERELKRLQESSGTWVAKTEGSIQNGDFVQVTVDGDKMTLIAGDTEHQKDSVLNQTVLGMKIGEEKTVTLPGEAGREEKSLQVHGVHERQLPEQDEEFLRRFGEDVTSLEVLKRRIRENLEDAAQTLVERRFRREAMVAYCRKAEVEVPEDLIEEGKTTRMNNFLEELKRDGMTLERYAELTSVDKSAMEESFRKMAAWDLKMAFVISKFSRENGLSVTDEELDAEILIMAKKFGKTEREVRKTLRENDRIDAIKENLLQAKMTDEIARRVVVRTAEETINLDQWKTLEDPEEGIFS
ncbi:MAG TPA: hypothetical protein VLH40_04275, partial [Atribacteraceae bacterium]|nr:hypothetical protein [Atribacteraceae bacterium]